MTPTTLSAHTIHRVLAWNAHENLILMAVFFTFLLATYGAISVIDGRRQRAHNRRA